MKTFLITMLMSIVLLSGVDYATSIAETPIQQVSETTQVTAQATEVVWYPGKFLIVRPIIRIHNRIKHRRGGK